MLLQLLHNNKKLQVFLKKTKESYNVKHITKYDDRKTGYSYKNYKSQFRFVQKNKKLKPYKILKSNSLKKLNNKNLKLSYYIKTKKNLINTKVKVHEEQS